MMAKLDDKTDLSPILAELNRCRDIDKNGKVTFSGLNLGDFGDIHTAIGSFVKFNPKLPNSLRNRTIIAAVFRAGQEGGITQDSLLKALKYKESLYISRPLQPFYLLSSLSIKAAQLTRLTVNNQMINFSANQPRKFNRNGLKIDKMLLEKEKKYRAIY